MGRITPDAGDERIILGRWSVSEIDRILAAAAGIARVGCRIAFISKQFLETPYQESTLVGDLATRELLTINLQGLDCFTYLDYVEAMRRSKNFNSFKETLRKVRYRAGEVAYVNRNHFFTDWIGVNPYVEEVTAKVGRERFRTVRKRLNDCGRGRSCLPGIEPRERRITYIPLNAVDASVIQRIRTGDYLGIYSRAKGLDVSHVGIAVRSRNRVTFRHASSSPSKRRVVEEDLMDYLAGKPGIVILRPRPRPRPSTR